MPVFGKKIFKYGNSFAMILPSEVVHGCGWGYGDMLVFEVKDKDRVVLHHVDEAQMIKLLEERDNIIQA